MKSLFLSLLLTAATQAVTIHQSANMGVRDSGPSVAFGDQGNGEFISATRFDVADGFTANVTSVGGHMSGGNQSTELFWAVIVRLPSAGSFPSTAGDENPFADSTVVGAAIFGAPQGSRSRDVSIPLTATLTSGSYALAFGAGGVVDDFLLGPGGFIQPSAANITDGSIAGFFLQFPRDGSENDTILRWNSFNDTWTLDSSNNNIRLYVEGDLVEACSPLVLAEALPEGAAITTVMVEGEEHFGVQFRRQSGGSTTAENVYTSTDYIYTVEVSGGLDGWDPALLQITYGTPIDHGDGTETVTAYLTENSTIAPAKKFMRIRVASTCGE